MNASLIFQIANPAATIAWLVLVLFPGWKYVRVFTVTIMSSLVFAGVYAFALGTSMAAGGSGNFSSLEGVSMLFQNPYALLAGWVHYLAFDLFVGSWISFHAQKLGISRWIILPSQFLTFMFGPIGLFTFLLIRALMRRESLATDPFA
ncbi:MAG TPA: ABA4-like family protein [Leptospiraceae bacterium]|jgi:hypothetical protein|nr:DUF4281 domain-containing protein [Leptospirales bacterium]HMU82093.1 ABA4-like family protein [Leptospiraceae bacterium]HMW61246.1 ABA4-like family protein [Leptospiraceae bacterium]HMX56707.1 ABA4-like family protein [Leptospiraceae bacterium]HMZ37024.1 ABA4-like family protein [Leptospiraceae bacterium]